MNKKYIVRLTAEEQKELENLVKKGKTQVYRMKHANIVLVQREMDKRLSRLAPNLAFGKRFFKA